MAALRTASAWSMNGRPFTAIPRTPCCKMASFVPGMGGVRRELYRRESAAARASSSNSKCPHHQYGP